MERTTVLKKILISILLVLIAVISFFLASKWASSYELFQGMHTSIDEKTQKVLELSAGSAAISTGITLLPGDAGSPIANKLADLTGYFLVILAVLYAEKNLLAVVGAIVFKIVIPVACALLILFQFYRREMLCSVAVKLIVLGIAVFVAIPAGIQLSDMIYENHKEIVETTASDAAEMNEETSQLSEADEEKNPVASILERLKETTSGLVDRATKMLNRYIESIAIMLVTTCVIPILSVVLILWLVNKLTGIKIDYPHPRKKKASGDYEKNEV